MVVNRWQESKTWEASVSCMSKIVKDCQRYVCLDPPVFATHVVSKTKQARSRHGNVRYVLGYVLR